MSTKTFFKRIALWAIVAMGAGFLGSAPASAASNPNATISATCVMRSGVGGFITVSGTGWWAGGNTAIRWTYYSHTLNSGASYSANTDVISSRILNIASDSSSSTMVIPLTVETAASTLASITFTVWADLGGTNTSSGGLDDPSVAVTCTDAGAPTKFGISGSTTATAGDTVTYTVTPQNASGATTILRPGTESFTVTLTPTAGRGKLYAGRATGTTGTTIIPGAGLADTNTTGGTVTLAAMAINGIVQSTWGNALPAGMPYDTMYYGGAAGSSAQITLTARHADAAPTFRGTGGFAGVAGGFHSESATSTGAFTVRAVVDSNTTATFVVEGAGALANSITGSATLTTAPQVYGTSYGFGSAAASVVAGYGITKGTTGWNAASPGITNPTAATPTGGIDATAATTQTIKVSTARTSIPLTVQLSQAGTFTYTVAAVTGFPVPTGVTAGTYTTTSATGVETQTAITITTTAPVAGQRFTVAFRSAANTTHTITMLYEAPQVGTSLGASVALTDTSSSMKVAAGGTVMGEVTVRDQYGSLVNGATCNWTVTGRNPTAAAVSTTTGANGTATYSYTDRDSTVSVTATATATDSLGVTCTSGNSGSFLSATSATYTWVASLTASAITASNNGATAGTAANGSVTVTVTVTDSTGAGLSGYPVTVSTDSKSFALTTGATSRTAYTNSSGVATATVYAKTAGTSVVTVTSGGKSTTSSYLVIAGSARTIALDATTASMAPSETKFLTATVKDSFGNVVDAQSVTVAYTGTAGRVVSLNGVSATTGTTNADGQIVIGLSGDAAGTGTLTLTFTGGDASTATLNDGSARPTRVASITAAVTIAGKSSTVTAVEAAQAAADAATDAALEAIDAANAATDAANLAAEAADAATVAAEEARDAADAATAAVEALATEVATLMSALKAQITTLARTVAKIAKKVNA